MSATVILSDEDQDRLLGVRIIVRGELRRLDESPTDPHREREWYVEAIALLDRLMDRKP